MIWIRLVSDPKRVADPFLFCEFLFSTSLDWDWDVEFLISIVGLDSVAAVAVLTTVEVEDFAELEE